MTNLAQMPGYRIGETDTRPWGMWEVLDTGTENGEEFCVKKITVNPGGILSLQSHNYRREIWTVLEGVLEVTRDKDILTLTKDQKVELPCGCLHRAINRTDKTVIIHEVQRGQCREDDIIRYEDAYGRQVQTK